MNDMSGVIQAERILRLESPLGPDILLPERCEVVERVSGLFEISLAVRSKRVDLAPQELVGELVDVSLELGGGQRRTWNGLVTHLAEGPRESRSTRAYHLTIRPEHWLLSQNADCRIFLDKTSVEVAEILLSEHGLAAPVVSGVAVPVPRQHYSVQWNETDLAFLTRRLEADGLFYWFEHEGGAAGSVAARHVMHLANHPVGYTADENTDVRFAMGSTDRNHVNAWERTFAFVPALRSGRDWNFETPSTVPGGETPGLVRLPKNGGCELYEYPAVSGYGSGSRASEGIDEAGIEARAKLRMQATEADHERVGGASTVRTLAAGRRFKPYDVANPDNTFEEHVVSAVRMVMVDRSYETQSDEPEYRNSFEAVPSRVPLTPHRDTRLSTTKNTPRPRIEGTQIAIVAGPPGEEIHPDEYGRIKLWFPWDRRAKKDGSDTCWVRVGQVWAGATWGAQTIPRIGMEVLVSHLDGDPDRPMVTGIVPNTRQKVPYELPGNKTRTVLRSQTHKGTGFNELTMEDEAGREEVFLHAQKDLVARVLNDRTQRIDRHAVESVGGNANIDVAQNHNQRVGANMVTSVGGSGLPLTEILGTVLSAGGQFMQANQARVGSPAVAGFASTVLQAFQNPLELASLAANGAVSVAGGHRTTAGMEHAAAGSQVGELLGSIMGGTGTMQTMVENFESKTVGLASSEQVGFQKNVVVGNTMTTSVGKYMRELVGEDIDTEAKNSIFARTKTHTLMAKEKFVIGGPGGTIIIDASGVTIKARHIWLKAPQVDIETGSPEDTELTGDKPFAEDCDN